MLCLESSFLTSLLDWVVVYVPNFSSNLVDAYRVLLYTFRVQGLCPFLLIKLLFIKKKHEKVFFLGGGGAAGPGPGG